MNYAYSGLDACLGSMWTMCDATLGFETEKVKLTWNWCTLLKRQIGSNRIEFIAYDECHCLSIILHMVLKKNISLFFPQSYEYEVNPRYRTKSKMNNRRANEKFCSRFVIFIESKFSINREVILRTFIWAHCLDDATIQHRLRRFRMVDKKSRLTHTY